MWLEKIRYLDLQVLRIVRQAKQVINHSLNNLLICTDIFLYLCVWIRFEECVPQGRGQGIRYCLDVSDTMFRGVIQFSAVIGYPVPVLSFIG